jgi:glutathione S-transferase
VRKRNGEYLVGDGDVFTIADIAVACAVTHIEFVQFRPGCKDQYPELAKWLNSMEEKENFVKTRPYMFDLRTENVIESCL